jgi:hypothetical protein
VRLPLSLSLSACSIVCLSLASYLFSLPPCYALNYFHVYHICNYLSLSR